MALVTLTSVINAFAYTGGPSPLGYLGLEGISLGYSGLGDLFVYVYFGFVATCAPYYLQAGELPLSVLAVAISVGALATAIIVVNNLRDRFTDVGAGKRTLAVRFGGAFARGEYAALVVGSYANLVLWYCVGVGTTAWLLPLLSAPIAVAELRAVFTLDSAALNPHVGRTALLQLAFGVLLTLGMLTKGGGVA